MKILNFTELLIKPALQDRSKCTTFRKAWDWLDEGWNKNACWREQTECRHKVGALEQLMWNQRGKNGLCGNCVRFDSLNRCVNDAYARLDPEKYALKLKPETKCLDLTTFSKLFGIGKILETQKMWMHSERGNLFHIQRNEPEFHEFELYEQEEISRMDGFKRYDGFCNFFIKTYPIIEREWMPFWRISWDWQKEGENEDL